ncbi:hypothetical protein MINS_04650 [Mycolicibacterium insubricum]|uniref:Uncharacterized protein n=3 Tax=Mycolicibacterium insubricum TaxID=444597 RepID=A0A1X0CVX1_9MYCO|nr:DUF5718 family protein [Mycolicibacterium insubricum]MCB9439324.1 hypothetical protein [Mycolicibacterium sp.]ORA64304.1 hypothetical protein BST26_19910 [Mycolicibacterium insubricum]BBZ65036.1 hypothetical protein MINS_04650 [Mycolicibacterium insubricum]
MIELDFDELRTWAGFGVAGNFAGHLEQAGEAVDFVNVASEGTAPKGIFPWYIPDNPGYLGEFPLSSSSLRTPEPNADGSPLNLQIEPEVGLACRVNWDGDVVANLEPFALGAFNDCSIRRPGAPKISVKKNWGPGSKGVAPRFFEISDLSPDGPTSSLRLECFLVRDDGQRRAYGVNSALQGYSFFGDRLLDWIVDRLANQKGSPNTPLEDVGALLVAAGRPQNVLIGIGATRYTELGESTYLQPGDTAIVRVYDQDEPAASTLEQNVV